jgi:hypothetical protein
VYFCPPETYQGNGGAITVNGAEAFRIDQNGIVSLYPRMFHIRECVDYVGDPGVPGDPPIRIDHLGVGAVLKLGDTIPTGTAGTACEPDLEENTYCDGDNPCSYNLYVNSSHSNCLGNADHSDGARLDEASVTWNGDTYAPQFSLDVETCYYAQGWSPEAGPDPIVRVRVVDTLAYTLTFSEAQTDRISISELGGPMERLLTCAEDTEWDDFSFAQLPPGSYNVQVSIYDAEPCAFDPDLNFCEIVVGGETENYVLRVGLTPHGPSYQDCGLPVITQWEIYDPYDENFDPNPGVPEGACPPPVQFP